ncbi:MAG: hypothetical protein CMC70_09825 [Flavobacteriaceae bacterium]|nr:hypothetical protein [Flavobacteriaceae bacterium]
MKFIATLFFAILAINSCGDSPNENSNTVTYIINSAKVPCEGVGKMQCFQIKKNATDTSWTNFYGTIEGFDYQQGYIYKISVLEEQKDPATVPADASTLSHKLLNVIEMKQDPTFRLHDIWALQALHGKKITAKTHQKPNKQPILELFVADKRIGGNDGCNSIFGEIENLTETQISFSRIGSTKMMCPNMEVSNAFAEALSNTTSYTLKNLHLYFYNVNGDEILKFVKVD